ncbi:hypothetical protein JL721_4876 [Aureococcus anophagefferens]|nr:hypothetical protein JL721_4876 [Aureococcus anophagefferens]
MGRISSHEFGSMDDKIWLLEHVFETQQTQAEKRLDDDHADADGGKRKSIKKNKRITRLKSPFYVGEGWILTGNTPKASVKATGPTPHSSALIERALPKEEAKRLTSAGNTSIKLIKRDLKICAFEPHLHGAEHAVPEEPRRRRFDGGLRWVRQGGLCTESFDFCREVHALKRDAVDLDFSSKSRLAKISEAYFQSGILNLSAKQRKALDKANDDAEAQGDSKILAEGSASAQQVYKEIQQSHITPFMKSKHYNGFLAEKFPSRRPADASSERQGRRRRRRRLALRRLLESGRGGSA